MQAFPHHYKVDSESTPSSDIILRSEGVREIPSTAPKEFGGTGHEWSPEGLLVASIADCYILTFKALSSASKFEWDRITCDTVGTLERVGRVTQFTRYHLEVRLTAADCDAAQAERLLQKAKKVCLITNSLTGECTLDASVESSL